MKRSFADLHLKFTLKETQAFYGAIQRAARFGYHYVAVSFSSEPSIAELKNLRGVCKNVGIESVLRIDICPRNENELMNNLRKLRRKFDIICVLCDNKEISRQAAKDRRVDLLNFPNFDYRKRFFDRSEAELAHSSTAALEIDVKPLLVLEGSARIRFISCLRREIAIAKAFDVPIIVSSGATEERFIRMPRDMASLSYMFGLSNVEAMDAVSSNPISIVMRNREKLDNSFIAPGIRIVKEDSDL